MPVFYKIVTRLQAKKMPSPCPHSAFFASFAIAYAAFSHYHDPMLNRITQRWNGPGGCSAVLRIAFPLILSTGSHSVQMFVDRMFLTWHSADAMSAALPAGILAFTIAAFFFGAVSYVNTFVAQYSGAGRPQRIGPAVWQGIFLALAGAVLLLPLIPAASTIFNFVNHDPIVRGYEITYFKILLLGTGPMLVSSAVSGFFAGRGKTWTILYVNLIVTAINITLDYVMILGPWGLPRLGIAGAGWATLIAALFGAVAFLWLFLRQPHRRRFATVSGARFDRDLMRRLLRYGAPNGIQFMLDVAAFSVFVLLVGRIDKTCLAATNMAFQISTLSFMPMIGFGIAVSTLVGQALGKNDPQLAQRSTWSAVYMTFTYMTLIAVGFWLLPQAFLYPFRIGADPVEFAPIASMAASLLGFVAFYCLFDTGNIILSGALKGAGDTRFVMIISIILSWLLMVVPCYLAITFQWGPHKGLYVAWASTTTYVCVLALVFLLRFLAGKWKTMRVIEPTPPVVPPVVPEIPTIEVDAP